MALHNLTITVVDGGKSGGEDWGSPLSKPKEEKKDGRNSLMYKVLNYNDTIKSSVKQCVSPTTFLAIQSGVGVAVQTTKQAINYYVSDIGRKNGDENYQAMVGRRLEQVTDVMSVGGGLLGGAAAGSVFGAGGALIGAVAGAASAGISLGFKYAERERAYQHEMFRDGRTQSYNLARANYSVLTGRAR